MSQQVYGFVVKQAAFIVFSFKELFLITSI
jgi:hypothetical protein